MDTIDFRRCRLRTGLAAVGLLLVLGCGMSDYEAKMSSEEKRVERYDRDEKTLGQPVEMPKGENDKAAKWNIFLRLPRPLPAAPGTASQPDMVTYPNAQGGGLFSYALLGVFPDQKLESIMERFKKSTFTSYRADTGDKSLESLGLYATDDGTNYLWIYPFRYSGGILVVVYASDGKKRKEEDDAIHASLATLAFGTGATRARLDYGHMHKK